MAPGTGERRERGPGQRSGLAAVLDRFIGKARSLAGRCGLRRGARGVFRPALLGGIAAIALAGGGAAVALLTLAAPPPVREGVHLLLPGAAERPAVVEGDSFLVVQPLARAALASLPALPPAPPLTQAVDPALLEKTGAGSLPKVARDGRMPRQVYGRPFDRGDDRLRLVLIIGGIGLSSAASQVAIDQLPASVVLAIDANAPSPENWARAARQAGHEVLATLPLQAAPPDDPGPAALVPAAGAAETLQQLASSLGRFTGYVGVLTVGGTAFGDDAVEVLRPVANTLHTRGLLLADATVIGGGGRQMMRAAPDELFRRAIDVVIDGDASAAAIDAQLDSLLSLSRQHLVAVALGRPTPLILLRLRSFIAALDEARYVVAPVSAVASTGDRP